MDPDYVCPISDVAFSYKEISGDRSKYQKREGIGAAASGKDIYISKDVVGNGVNHITVAPKLPCLDTTHYNAAPNQQFWFAELRRKNRECKNDATNYQPMA